MTAIARSSQWLGGFKGSEVDVQGVFEACGSLTLLSLGTVATTGNCLDAGPSQRGFLRGDLVSSWDAKPAESKTSQKE